jgi:hypothetical protein
MKPYLHANLSAKKYGGKPEDYYDFHEFFDSSKAAVADVRHRAMLHSAWGIYLASRVFGEYLTNSEGKKVSTRDLGEHHVIQDLGFIPTMQDWLDEMPIKSWMSGTRKRTVLVRAQEVD